MRCFFGRHDWVWLGGNMPGLKRCSRCSKWGVVPWIAERHYRRRR